MYTQLPELWELFNKAVSISSMTSDGLLTLSLLDTMLQYSDKELDVTYDEFWEAMTYFLNRSNLLIFKKRSKKNGHSSSH